MTWDYRDFRLWIQAVTGLTKGRDTVGELKNGVPGVISRKFSVREIATKSLVGSRDYYI